MRIHKSKLTDTDSNLAEIVSRLSKAYKPCEIFLFGSRANGNARLDSDYDIMIVVNDNAEPEFKSSKVAYDVLWGIDASVDVLVWTRESFNKRVHIPNSLPAEILRSGERLHVA